MYLESMTELVFSQHFTKIETKDLNQIRPRLRTMLTWLNRIKEYGIGK